MMAKHEPTIGEQLAEAERLRVQRANVLIYCNKIAAEAAAPPYPIPPPPWVVKIRELLDWDGAP